MLGAYQCLSGRCDRHIRMIPIALPMGYADVKSNDAEIARASDSTTLRLMAMRISSSCGLLVVDRRAGVCASP